MAVKKGKEKPARRGFYLPALGETQRLMLEEAAGMQGLDDEIAVLRVKLFDLLRDEPGQCELALKVATAIASLVKIRYSISREQKRSLREAISKVLTELAVPLGVKALLK
jgi:hypothetical protein